MSSKSLVVLFPGLNPGGIVLVDFAIMHDSQIKSGGIGGTI